MFQRLIQFLANGFSKSFFAEFKEGAHRCGTEAITAELLADRTALSHTTCTAELGYSVLLVLAHTEKHTEVLNKKQSRTVHDKENAGSL